MAEPQLPPRVRRLFRLPWRNATRVARDVDDELRFHVEMRIEEFVASGMSPNDAAAEAWRQLGDADDVRRHALAMSVANRRRARLRELGWGLVQDARFAQRQIRRAPLFAGVAVFTLGLGIAANSAIFSVVHHLVLAPLPYRSGDRIVRLMRSTGGGHIMFATTAGEVEAWRARAHTLATITAASPREFTIGSGGARERATGGEMEPNLLDFLELHPYLGRAFDHNDARPGAAPVAILGYGLWQRRFGGRPDAIGKVIVVDDTSRMVIGVAPPGLSIPMNENQPAALWTPLVPSAANLNPLTFATLRRGSTPEQAERELTAIDRALAAGAAGASVRAMRPQDFLGGDFQRALFLLFGAVGVVLLIACANVANLLLVRSSVRQREFAVRTALGASRARLTRQLLTESLVLAAAAGVLGLALAWGGLHLFRGLRPVGLEELDGVRVEPAVLLWTGGLALLTGILFGSLPTLIAARRGEPHWVRTGTRGAAIGRGAHRLRSTLVIGEIALSAVLLVSAGLLMRSFRAMEQTDLGFEPRGLSSVSVQLARDTPKDIWRDAFVDVLTRVRALPGVAGAAFATDAPPSMGVSAAELQIDAATTQTSSSLIAYGAVQAAFFRVAGIHLRGRTFSGDTTGLSDGPAEAIINEKLARRLWPRVDAIGHRLRMGPKAPWLTVVGIAQNLAVPGRHGDAYDLQLYVPANIGDIPAVTIVMRSDREIDAVSPELRRVAAEVDPRLEVWRMQSSDTQLAALLAGPRFAMALIGALALTALALSVVGLYGVIAYTVAQRAHEIGVRLALGAEPRDIGRLVLRDGAMLALLGLTIGLPSAAAVARTFQSYLYGVRQIDLPTYAAIGLLLAAIGCIAAYVPARRARGVDPMGTLNAE